MSFKQIDRLETNKEETKIFSKSLKYDWAKLEDVDALEFVLLFIEAKRNSMLGDESDKTYYRNSLNKDKPMFRNLVKHYSYAPLDEIENYINKSNVTLKHISSAAKIAKKIENSRDNLKERLKTPAA